MIKKLEMALLPKPLFGEPISRMKLNSALEDVPESSSRIKDASNLLIRIW